MLMRSCAALRSSAQKLPAAGARSSAASQRTHLLAGAQPVVQSVQAPQVRGVAVLCQGGGNAGTQRRITELVSALTGVGASHITVNKMQS